MKNISVLLFLLITLALNAQNNKTSGLNARQFHKYWKVESESPDYKVTFLGDTVEILSPKGLTLWRKEKMNEENLTYADAMQRLEDISARLENGSVPLEESIALYEESAKLAAFCKQILQQAQQKITELAGDEK